MVQGCFPPAGTPNSWLPIGLLLLVAAVVLLLLLVVVVVVV